MHVCTFLELERSVWVKDSILDSEMRQVQQLDSHMMVLAEVQLSQNHRSCWEGIAKPRSFVGCHKSGLNFQEASHLSETCSSLLLE